MLAQSCSLSQPHVLRRSQPASCNLPGPSRSRLITCAAANGGGAGRRKKNTGKHPGLFEVNVVTPPPRYLGTYALPPLTHNNDEIEIEGAGTYVVTALVVQYKLQQGKYQRHHSRLEVQPTSRWLTNQHLEQLLKASGGDSTGPQD